MKFFLPDYAWETAPNAAPATGWLVDAARTAALPVVGDLILADHADWPLPDLIGPRTEALHAELQAQLPAYEEFLRRKNRRPVFDAYVGFQPFNEATKAFFPFVALLRRQLRPGDLILNLWDRSGYLASLLAGLFPEQTILTHWEGDRDVLGYKGYAHWFTGPDAPPNLRVFFSDLQKPLPLPDARVALVVATDVLHRFDQHRLLRELLRVTRPDGGLLFPHVHLANAEPEPFFERGGRRLHGRQLAELFEKMTAPGGREALIFSEPDLFLFNETGAVFSEKPLRSTPDTPDYNGLVALLPPAWRREPLRPFRPHEQPGWETCRVLVNPLPDLRHPSGRVRLAPDAHAGTVGHLLERHPVYHRRLQRASGYALSDPARRVLYWADRARTAAEIADGLGVSTENLHPLLTELAALDLIQLVPLGEACHRRQHYLSTQEFALARAEQTLAHLWQRAVARYAEHQLVTTLDDGSACTYAEADELVGLVRASLRRDGLRPGDAVALCAPLHAEGLLLAWACWREGLVLVPVSAEWPAATLRSVLDTVAPRLLLTTAGAFADLRRADTPTVLVDEETAETTPAGGRWFAEWLAGEAVSADAFAPTPDTPAAVLFTSGSTGQPKGVPLTHGQLFRSTRLVTETFGWEATDRYLAVADLDSMSGLRNAALAPLEVGASVVIPRIAQKQTALGLSEAVGESRATLLAAAPPLLRQWAHLGSRLAPALRSLRLVLSTGSALTPALRDEFSGLFGPPVVNYYGLTETTGICLAERPAQVAPDRDTVGWPVGCLAQVVDETGHSLPVGEVGELRIFGENVLVGPYVGAPEAVSPVRDGWLYTGDLARFNPDGSLTLRGRRSERIKNAHGEVVYPAEVEAQALGFPAVRDAAACAFEQHDTEKLALFLTLREGFAAADVVSQLPTYLAGRVGTRKVPALFRVLDALPRTATGKIRREMLLHLLQP